MTHFRIAAAVGLLTAATVLTAHAQTATPDFKHKPAGDLQLEGNAFGYSAGGDLNGDGIDELVIMTGSFPERKTVKLPILTWNGKKFRNKARDFINPVPSNEGFLGAIVEDFNADGRSDLYIAGYGYDADDFAGAPDYMYLQRKSGPLKDISDGVDPGENTTYFVTTGDINNDSYPDVFAITLDTTKETGPHFVVSKGAGKYRVRRNLINPDYAAPPDQSAAISAAAIADFDNDGWDDLMVGREDGRYVGVYFNDGGSFRRSAPDLKLPPLAHGAGSSHPLEMKAVDFNLDGFMDVIIFSVGWPDFAPHALQFYKNVKGKRFKDVTGSAMPDGPVVRTNLPIDKLQLVDFFGDGLLDLVAVEERGSESTNYIFTNDGSGRFKEHNWQFFRDEQGHSYRNLIAANLDGDNRTDIVTAHFVETGDDTYYHFDAYLNEGVADQDVKKKPKIVRQPAAGKVSAGKRLHLSVLARGDRPLSYTWFKDGKKLKGETGPVYVKSKVKDKHAGKYRVKVKNAKGTVKSDRARIRVK